MPKHTHKTKDGRTARKGLYYYANKRRKAGKKPIAKGKKGFVTKAAIKRSAKTAFRKKKVINEENYKSTKRLSFYERQKWY